MKRLSYILLVLVLLFYPFDVYGSEVNNNSEFARVESINPDSPAFYKVKRLKEKIGLFLRFSSDSKVDYYIELSSRRLAELKYLAEKEDTAYIEKASQRYEATIGEMVELISSDSISKRKEETLSLLSEQRSIVESLTKNYEFNNAQWRFVMNGANSIDLYKGILQLE